MKRLIYSDLLEWKNSKQRKPLLLLGVRQCGKTWTLLDFGEKNYKNVVHLDFYGEKKYGQFFRDSMDPKRIIDQLRLAGHKIAAGETLLIFDEIQECPEALGSLKYFYEKTPEYHIACAGSLLGVRLSQGVSFPVGKVDYLRLHPMTFSEFLLADDASELTKYIKEIKAIEPIPELIFDRYVEKLKLYFAVGGLPEAVNAWVTERDMNLVEKILKANIMSYDLDFSKHLTSAEANKVSLVLHTLPSQLAKENKKFMYKIIKDGARAREYEPAIKWLEDADMITRVNLMKSPGLPISSYEDHSSFKVYAADVGLLRVLSDLDSSTLATGDAFFTDFKGSFSENYILNALSTIYETPLRYWAKENSSAEVDFILQNRNEIIPIEVKAATNVQSKGLKRYKEDYPNKVGLRVRYSLKNLLYQDGILNIPLFLADATNKLLDIQG
jgi:predicted AAA+ superfamily ATPase